MSAVLALQGCAARYEQRALARSEALIRAAELRGARQDSEAALYLRYAQEEVDDARSFFARGDESRANWMLARASSDAELSAALARENRARAVAQRAVEAREAVRWRDAP